MENSRTERGDPARGAAVTLTLYARTPVAGARTDVIDRLHSLAGAGAVDEFDVVLVRGSIVVSEGGGRERTDELVAAAEELAGWRDGDVRSAFDVRDDTTLTGRSVRAVDLPATTLRVEEDGDLAGVFPCTDGTQRWDATDCLDSLERSGTLPTGVESALAAE